MSATSTSTSVHPGPRLAPIERPRGVLLRVAYRMSRRMFGAVITPMKVVYARVPGLLWVTQAMVRRESRLGLEPELRSLLKSFVATLNGCGFCVDIARAAAAEEGIPAEKYEALLEFATSPLFTPRERAALEYAREATLHRRVGDDTFQALERHFTEREIVEITWLNAMENYYNLLTGPLRIGSDGLCELRLGTAGRGR